MKSKRFSVIVSILLIASIWYSVSSADSNKITILHTNDMHGAFLPSPATWVDATPKPLIGGFLALEHYLKLERTQIPNTLLLDAGDLMTGNEICNIEYRGAKGGALIEMMNTLGYEGMTLGNHEFDVSQENILKLIELSEFPVYSANLYKTNGQLFAPKAYYIYEKQGLRIGVIGIITEQLFDVLNFNKRENLVVKPNAETINEIADEIDDETDLIVILSHCGADEDSALAEKLDRRIDVIVGGHSHTRIEKAREVNHILIVQAGSKCRYLGKLDLTVAGDTIQTFTSELVPLWVDAITPEPKLETHIRALEQQIDAKFGRVIAQLKTDLKQSHHNESNLGNYVADCMREYTGADFAGINSGGIRKSMPAGVIKIIDIREILPFDNAVWTFKVTGEQLLRFMENNARASAFEEHGIVQISGLTTHYRKIGANQIEITKALVNGEPLQPEKIYTGATVDFVLIANCDKYLGIKPADLYDSGIVISDMVLQITEQKGKIAPKIEGRLKEVQ
ncbi:bifunctional metallophosphatase/5'-nucleotidase [candidate division KSB1 bacterium]|nr:bifunctional metallophosphatase/5'-nucleotidase [candidate division KSB1 bacterium]